MFNFFFALRKNPVREERGEERRVSSIHKKQVKIQRSFNLPEVTDTALPRGGNRNMIKAI